MATLNDNDLTDSSKASGKEEYGFDSILSTASLGALDHDTKEELKLGANRVQLKNLATWNNECIEAIQSQDNHYFNSLNLKTDINIITSLQDDRRCRDLRTSLKEDMLEFKNKAQQILVQYNNIELQHHQQEPSTSSGKHYGVPSKSV